MFYFFGKGKCTEVFQGIRDITPEVYCLIGIHLFSSFSKRTQFTEVLLRCIPCIVCMPITSILEFIFRLAHSCLEMPWLNKMISDMKREEHKKQTGLREHISSVWQWQANSNDACEYISPAYSCWIGQECWQVKWLQDQSMCKFWAQVRENWHTVH